MPSPNLSEIATTTIASRTRALADNVTDNTSLLKRLKTRGKIKPVSGGETINQELEYAENSTYTRFSGYETLNIQPSDVFTSAVYNWKQVSVAVTISGLEEIKNAGKEAFISLLGSRIRNAEKTMTNGLSTDLYSDGTANGGKQVTGLAAQVSSSPSTGTVGGIPRADHEFWRNASQTASANLTKDTIRPTMQKLWLKQMRNTDKPDLIAMDNNFYGLYWESLADLQRFANADKAKGGYNELQFVAADVVADGGIGGSAPSNSAFFLNCDYIHWRPSSRVNMKMSDSPFRHQPGRDGSHIALGWQPDPEQRIAPGQTPQLRETSNVFSSTRV